jgi:NSS family neurotransmitter:Na+ symporter
MKYIFGFLTGDAANMANGSYFGSYISSVAQPVIWFLVFITLTAAVVIFGVNKGIEKVSKIMMPALVVLMLFIVIFTLCTGGRAIWDGVLHYIKPDFSQFTVMTVVAAAGQLFYSMSLAMGIMITFGSYTKKDIRIEKSTKQIEFFDTGIAFLAGLMIIPVVFANDPSSIGKSGPGLMFSVLPHIFDGMPAGTVIGAVFFIMVFFAALTSSISLMETIVSIIMDKLKTGRTVSCVIVWVFSIVLGLLSCLGYSAWSDVTIIGLQFLDFFDFTSNSLLMPIVAFLTCIFVGYVIKPKAVIEEVELSGPFKAKSLFTVIIKYVAPVILLIILATSVVDVFSPNFNI